MGIFLNQHATLSLPTGGQNTNDMTRDVPSNHRATSYHFKISMDLAKIVKGDEGIS